MKYLKLQTNLPVDATLKSVEPIWKGENKFGSYQHNYAVIISGEEQTLTLSSVSPAIKDLQMFKAGDKITIIKKEEGTKKWISIFPQGDIQVQSRNIGLPTPKETKAREVAERKNEAKQEELSTDIHRQVALKCAVMNLKRGTPANEVIKLSDEFLRYLEGVQLPFN
jgi:hypothetical protein